jgi:hypothetical protein
VFAPGDDDEGVNEAAATWAAPRAVADALRHLSREDTEAHDLRRDKLARALSDIGPEDAVT